MADRNAILLFLCLIAFPNPGLIGQNAPVTTIGTRICPGIRDTVPVTVSNFINMASGNLCILYDHNIVTIESVIKAPDLAGSLDVNKSKTDTLLLGWFTYPSDTLPDYAVAFRIICTKVTSGTTPFAFYDNGNSCLWYNGSWSPLNDLPTSAYYFPGSLTWGVPLAADFSVDNTAPPKNTTVQFTDLTAGNPTSWAWSFDRASVTFVNGTNATSQNPQVQFTDGGPYTVTLIASNGSGSSMKIKTDYIWAGTPGLWYGGTSSDWATGVNWDNWRVPVSATAVVIPALANFWPTYTGDLTLGSACLSLTLNGASEMSVTGNLFIASGTSLVISETGTFRTGGNWTNGGTFTAGTGTVEFFGTAPAGIIAAGSPTVINHFHHLTISKGSQTLDIAPDIHVNGNLTINP